MQLSYDAEWLAIMRATNSYASFTRKPGNIPTRNELDLDTHIKWVTENVTDLKIPLNFTITGPTQIDKRQVFSREQVDHARKSFL